VTIGNDSIWYYTRIGFRDFITTISDKTIAVIDALDTLREKGVLPKRFKEMTVQELCSNSNLIGEVYDALSKMLPESKFRFEYKIADREQELIQTITSNYSNIDVGKARVKIVSGRHRDDIKELDFCYAIEVAIAPEKDHVGETVRHAGEVQFIGCINNGTSTDNGESYYANGKFVWFDKKAGIDVSAKGIRDLLAVDMSNTTSLNESAKSNLDEIEQELETSSQYFKPKLGKVYIIRMDPQNDKIMPVENDRFKDIQGKPIERYQCKITHVNNGKQQLWDTSKTLCQQIITELSKGFSVLKITRTGTDRSTTYMIEGVQ